MDIMRVGTSTVRCTDRPLLHTAWMGECLPPLTARRPGSTHRPNLATRTRSTSQKSCSSRTGPAATGAMRVTSGMGVCEHLKSQGVNSPLDGLGGRLFTLLRGESIEPRDG